MKALAPRERRAVALLILITLIVLVYLLIGRPVVDGFSSRAERRAELELQYQVNQRIIAAIPRTRRQAEMQRANLTAFTLPAASPVAASPLLQDRLIKSVEAVGGQLRSTEDVTATDGLAHARVSAQVTLAQLSALLVLLQDARPYLAIDALSVNADQALISRKLEPLDVSIEVSVPLGRPAPR